MNHPALLVVALSMALPASLARASSCNPDEAVAVDQKIAHYQESICARKALDSAAELFRAALSAEARGDGKTLCNGIHAALMMLDHYGTGAWRSSHGNIADKIDASFDEKLARFETTTCPQKLAIYRHLALKNNSWAMFRLAESYAKGAGLPQDDGEALAWYQQAADRGYTTAYVALGLMFSDGLAFTADYPVAYEWFAKAAAQGDAEGQYRLGNMLRRGLGVTLDAKLAAAWFRKAAEQGHSGAKAALTDMYQSGETRKPFFGL